MAIKEDFQDNTELYVVREQYLNPALKQINANDLKIKGLQDIVYRSFVKSTIDSANNTLTFETGDGTEEKIDFSDMLNKMQHGVDINKKGSATKPNVELISFSGNVEVSDITGGVEVAIPEMKGEVDTTSPETSIKKVFVRGNKGASQIDANGVLTIDLPDQPIVPPPASDMEGQIGTGGTPAKIKKVQILGYTTGSTLTNETLSINVPDYTILQGKVGGAPNYQDVRKLRITGNTATSSFAGDEMAINIPYLLARKDKVHGFNDVGRIEFTGYTDNIVFNSTTTTIKGMQPLSVFQFGDATEHVRVKEIMFANADVQVTPDGDDNKILVTPKGITAKIDSTGPDIPIGKIDVTGNKGATKIDKSVLTLDFPSSQASTDGTTYEDFDKILLTGNRGASEVKNGTLTIELAAGGGGGGSISGQIDTGTPENITKVKLTGNTGSSSLASDTLTIDIPMGGGGSITGEVNKTTGIETETITKVVVQGDADTSKVENSTLTIDIPTPAISVGKTGGTAITAVNAIEFADNVTITDSSSGGTHKAVVKLPEIQATVGTTEGPLKEIEVNGDLGATAYHDGKLLINLQAGGGGGGGSGVTGMIGTESTPLDRLQITGNVDGSSVDPKTKTMVVKVPPMVGISDGSRIVEKIDIVEVAQSTVALSSSGGRRKALITPHITFFYLGWFSKMSELEAFAGEPTKRIPTKTCGHVLNTTTGQTDFWMWMPPMSGTGSPGWVKTKPTSALEMYDRGNATAPICSVKKNPMTEVDTDGMLIIKDTTVPETLVDVLDNNGSTLLKSGKFSTLKFIDWDASILDETGKVLTINRPQRRVAMGSDPDTTVPHYGVDRYQGSIFFNTDDKCWWGYSNPNPVSGEKKWTRVIHEDMSTEVASLVGRVPEYLQQASTLNAQKDNDLWKNSGWTGVPKDAQVGILPGWAQNQQGMVIQTFRGPSGSGTPGAEGRLQIGYMGADATMFKRYRDEQMNDWSEWKKMSFNEGDLLSHNKDKAAHRWTHPYYEVFSFGTNYVELASDKKGLFKYIIENEREAGLIASSGAPFAKDGVGVKVPYTEKYNVRGMVYIGGPSDLANKSVKGDWVVELQKCEASSSIFSTIYTQRYQHHSTSLKYPPFTFDFYNVSLEEGDFLRLKIQFKPDPGKTEAQFLSEFPNLWIMPGRSYFSVDVNGNDTGYCIGKNMSRMYGGFSPLGGGAFGYASGTWPNDTGHIVGDGIEDAVAAG